MAFVQPQSSAFLGLWSSFVFFRIPHIPRPSPTGTVRKVVREYGSLFDLCHQLKAGFNCGKPASRPRLKTGGHTSSATSTDVLIPFQSYRVMLEIVFIYGIWSICLHILNLLSCHDTVIALEFPVIPWLNEGHASSLLESLKRAPTSSRKNERNVRRTSSRLVGLMLPVLLSFDSLSVKLRLRDLVSGMAWRL
ncbi:hypothetical protein MGYG_02902 [Nannizzia gypsea CBS 118893]|uniref:Uncharacterized protein n=1 Tax=Arthroderma gypseum (strain ATCC MYA-4604 / CBS 118893) TaxID=535722 RepID=E4UPL5_ARTGP|nr:hypothetical protein MGYG_02902 [Nannizzia gypsea CBS 118893]EFQ99890.1 hypothetical protein MGYG_02902 [Nannizzia gypsea CBS 118893]